MTVRVVLADDHPAFLAGLELLLGTSDGIDVVGTASDGDALIELAREVDFDVAVVDLDMPVLDGATAARELAALRPRAAVLVLTMHDDDGSVLRAVRAGAAGYVLKGAAQGAIARAVHAVAEGDTVFGGGVGRSVRRSLSRPGGGRLGLTPRECEVLDLVAQGDDNATIARALFLSTKTVQNTVSAILAKVGASSRAQLVALARDHASTADD